MFIRKHDLASSPVKVAPILPIFVGLEIDHAAFQMARQHGISAVTIEMLLGLETAKAFPNLIDLLSNTGPKMAEDQTKLYQVLHFLTSVSRKPPILSEKSEKYDQH